MKIGLFIVVSVFAYQSMVGQDGTSSDADFKYREDQFYFGVTYNLLGKLPQGMSQNGFSSGFHLGFIRDMPINENRTVAIGIGIGYSANSFNQNLLISKDEQGIFNFELLEDEVFTKNKFSNHLLEIPLEIRWRTSTPKSYKFWRVYTGIKLGYVIASTSKYNGSPQNVELNNLKIFEKFQYGFTLSIGYNTWNAYLYYALSSIFEKEASLNAQSIDLNAIKIGLIFYIL